jgi:hypothetical protein
VGDLRAEISGDPAAVILKLVGTADMRATELVDTLLLRVHEQARSRAVFEARVDFRALDFMNSSCFKGFVTWIRTVAELAADQQYRITLLSNPKILWQRRSLHALGCFAPDLVTVEAIAT